MNILIGADFVPTESNSELFSSGNTEELFGKDLQNILDEADLRIFNLECPLTDTNDPISKCGPNLSAETECIQGYLNAKADLLTLANNHIMDQGTQGLRSTIDTLDKNKIAHIGAGKNLPEASKPYITEIDGKRIGVYACAEHEFSIATEDYPGANPFDPLESLDHISSLKQNCDYLIVLYHGGMEYYRYPSPQLQKFCRKLIEKGANLVVTQHSHCVGCKEDYLSGTIIYGQGNFLFDHGDDEFWNSSILLQITDGFKLNFITLKKNGATMRLANESEEKQILSDFIKRSEEISNSAFIKNNFEKFSLSKINKYFGALHGRKSILFRILNKLTKRKLSELVIKNSYPKRNLLQVLNYIECEAHRELIISCCHELLSSNKE